MSSYAQSLQLPDQSRAYHQIFLHNSFVRVLPIFSPLPLPIPGAKNVKIKARADVSPGPSPRQVITPSTFPMTQNTGESEYQRTRQYYSQRNLLPKLLSRSSGYFSLQMQCDGFVEIVRYTSDVILHLGRF